MVAVVLLMLFLVLPVVVADDVAAFSVAMHANNNTRIKRIWKDLL